MRRATILETSAVLLAVGLSLFAKGGMVRITIRGEHLANPIESQPRKPWHGFTRVPDPGISGL